MKIFIQHLIQSSRLYHWPVIVLNAIISCFIVNGEWDAGLVIGIELSLLSSYGFVSNDLFDIRIDTYNNVSRLEGLSYRQKFVAAVISIAYVFIALLLAEFFLPNSLFLVSFILVILTLYNILFKKILVLGTLLAGLAIISPLWGPFFVFFVLPSNFYLLLFSSALLFNLSREVLMDIFDSGGDAKYHRHTIPTLFGKKNSYIFSLIVKIFGGIIIAVAPFALGDEVSIYGKLLLVILSVIIFLFGMRFVLLMEIDKDYKEFEFNKYLSFSRVSMLLFPTIMLVLMLLN